MRIVHVSDIHIRNFRYLSEYRESLEELHRQLLHLHPDVVINTGDTVHAKTHISPEMVEMLAWHVQAVAEIAPYRMILGNHDLNLKNPDRRDAISPVVCSLREAGVDVQLWEGKRPQVVYYRHGGGALLPAMFWPFDIRGGHPTPDEWSNPKIMGTLRQMMPKQEPVHIGLFHGSISGCLTDSEWTINGAETELSAFDGLDFVMMGDIHRHQSWKDGRVAYAGSLIQQNFGETPDKGFLVWDIHGPDEFKVEHHPLRSPLCFYTVGIGADLEPSVDQKIPTGAYVRAVVDGSFTSVEQRRVATTIRERYAPKDVLVVSTVTKGQSKGVSTGAQVSQLDSAAHEQLLRAYLEQRGVEGDDVERIVSIDRLLHAEVNSDESLSTLGHRWRVNRFGWTNVGRYGSENIIDLGKTSGVYGIFGHNNQGKSTIFDVLTEGLFDRVAKEVPRNVDLINDSLDEAKIIIDLTANDVDYVIERTIERVKQKKSDSREWGKMSLDLYRVEEDGTRISLNCESRADTEREIRRLIGEFDDFVLSSMSPQGPISGVPGGGDFIGCKDTERRRLLCRILGLEVFERKLALAREMFKVLVLPTVSGNIVELEAQELALSDQLEELTDAIEEETTFLAEMRRNEQDIREQRAALTSARSLDSCEDPNDIREALARHIRDQDLRQKRIDFLLSERSRLAETLLDKPDHVDDPTDNLRTLEKEIQELTLVQRHLETSLTSARKKIQILQDVPCGDSFPHCRFLTDANESKGKIPNVQDELERVNSQLERSSIERSAADRKMSEWRAFDRSCRDRLLVEKRLAELQAQLSTEWIALQNDEQAIENCEGRLRAVEHLTAEFEKIAGLDGNLAETMRIIASIESKLNKLRSDESKCRESLAVRRERISVVTEEIRKRASIESDRHILEIYCDAVGKNGIPRSILSTALPSISREMNRIVSSVSSSIVSLESDEDEQSLSLLVGPAGGRMRPVALSGGAERFIVSLAMRAALCNVSVLPRSNVFIVDEGFGKLDQENSQAIQRMFQVIRGMFDSIMIVSHTEVMRDMVDGTIDIGVDQDGYSHVDHT